MTTATKRAKGRKAAPAKAAPQHTTTRGPIPVGARVRIAYRPDDGVWEVRREMLCGATRYLVLAQDGFIGYPTIAEDRCELAAETTALVVAPKPVAVVAVKAAPVGLWEAAG